MNIMLAAVTERIKEIGLRKAVGAKRGHIVNQFLTETIIISFTGAIIGIIIGIALAYLISIIVNKLGYQWDFVITLFSILLSCFFAFLIGLIFGLYPARKAARLDPIEALRYE
jgi:putative ABC transport system permease protein